MEADEKKDKSKISRLHSVCKEIKVNATSAKLSATVQIMTSAKLFTLSAVNCYSVCGVYFLRMQDNLSVGDLFRSILVQHVCQRSHGGAAATFSMMTYSFICWG